MPKSRRKRPARRFVVKVSLDGLELNKNTGTFRFPVYASGEKLGELTVGQGSVRWFKRSAKQATVKMGWQRFAAIMERS